MTEMRQPQSGPFLSLLPSLCRISSGWICWWSSNKQTNKLTGLCIILIFKWKMPFIYTFVVYREWIYKSYTMVKLNREDSTSTVSPVSLNTSTCSTFSAAINWQKGILSCASKVFQTQLVRRKKKLNKKRFPKISRRQCTTLGTL